MARGKSNRKTALGDDIMPNEQASEPQKIKPVVTTSSMRPKLMPVQSHIISDVVSVMLNDGSIKTFSLNSAQRLQRKGVGKII